MRQAIKQTFISSLTLIGMLAAQGQAQNLITIKGSDTMLILNQELGADYRIQRPDIQFEIEGRGSSTGIAALLEGTADIAAASRQIKESELAALTTKYGCVPLEIAIAMDGIGIYVHNHNPITQLTLEQLDQILQGNITQWNQVGGQNRAIHIYNRDKNSGTRSFIQKNVLKNQPFSSLARDVSSTALVMSTVARNPGAIGYGGIAYSEGARIIRLANKPGELGLWPSAENVSNQRYPLSRALYYYVNPRTVTQTVRDYIDWVMTPAGQSVVDFVGYYPAPSSDLDWQGQEPSVSDGPIPLTAGNMERHGFDLSIQQVRDRSQSYSRRMTITLQFYVTGQAIKDIDTIKAFIGEDIEVPLQLQEDLSLRMVLPKSLIEETRLELHNEQEDQTYHISLEEF